MQHVDKFKAIAITHNSMRNLSLITDTSFHKSLRLVNSRKKLHEHNQERRNSQKAIDYSSDKTFRFILRAGHDNINPQCHRDKRTI